MPSEAIGAIAPEATEATIVMDVDPPLEPRPDAASTDPGKSEATKPLGLHSPPGSSNATNPEPSDSELSDVEDMVADQLRAEAPAAAPEDIGEVLPDHYSGTVPVFKPTMHQFKDFKLFMEKIDSYGMQSGIVKIIPPEEWKESIPSPDDMVKQIRVREPIKQDIMGTNGTYRQVNILHQRSYNLPQWRQLCDQSEHQPPARRGERRANVDRPKPAPRTRAAAAPAGGAAGATPKKSAPGKKRRGRGGRKSAATTSQKAAESENRPITPVSPAPEEQPIASVEDQDAPVNEDEDNTSTPSSRKRMGFSRQANPSTTQSTSARRKYSKREGSAKIDEAAFKDFDYRMDVSDYTPERCEELERIYWKTLTYAPPLYGADLMGTLFDDSVESWNLNNLPNLLDVLGTKVPGVNTAYLYLGMWKATFAWHLEDVDLYSINYLHFGAPKQWYSISQKDARRFEAAMKNIWSSDAKACDQFLRHKAFLISPNHLKQHYNITVNKCVSYPGEFVVTYPYGYHSGYNLGYNCAEAVNFALDSWLPMGKIAKRCECAQAQDSVWVDVYEIERKLRGISTDYGETEDEEELESDEDGESGLPSPPSSRTARVKIASKKRKRSVRDKDGKTKVKKVRLRTKTTVEPVCCLCPNDIPGLDVLPTDDGRKAHRMCVLYIPETFIETVDGKEIVANAANVNKARLDLKCLFCRSKKGACFQCSQKKCARAYHATCAAAAGVFVEEAEVPVFGEDGTEYKEQAFEFSCRFHRTKRDRKLDGDALDGDSRVRDAARAIQKGQICQFQYYRGDIFAGIVAENRHDEETLLLEPIPQGYVQPLSSYRQELTPDSDRLEVEWKWLLLPDPTDLRLPKASSKAIPMPASRQAKGEINVTKRLANEVPRKDDVFAEGYTWAEFHTCEDPEGAVQARVDISKENTLWHYLAKTSTETKAQYTGDMAKPVHDPKSNFLVSVPKPKPKPKPKPAHAPMVHRQDFYPGATTTATNTATFTTPTGFPPRSMMPPPNKVPARAEKPYVYKPKKPVEPFPKVPAATQSSTKVPVPFSAAQQYWHSQQQQFSSGTDSRQVKGPPTAITTPPTSAKATTASYSSNRFAPLGGSNGFPQLPGLTRPPAHMKSGPYPQSQPTLGWSPSHSATAGPQPYPFSPPAPMTSSLLKSNAEQQPQPARAFQKYSFFQVHHNREPSRYRTPYAAWGGFTNGYEGNLRAFLLKAQQSLSGGKPSSSFRGIPAYLLGPHRSDPGKSSVADYHQSVYSPSHEKQKSPQQASTGPTAIASASWAQQGANLGPPSHSSPSPAYPHFQPPTITSPCPDSQQPRKPSIHPAIRPQSQFPPQHNAHFSPSHDSQGTRPQAIQQATSVPTPPKGPLFNKQSHSPIPLPPYVRKSQPNPPAARPSASPVQQHPESASLAPTQAATLAANSRGGTFSTATSQAVQPAQEIHESVSQVHPLPHPSEKAVQGSTPGTEPVKDSATVPTVIRATTHLPQPATPTDDVPQEPRYKPDHSEPPARQDPETPPEIAKFAEVPADTTALIERMMLNLRRASGAGRSGD